MKKLFGLFVFGILSSTAMAELVCFSPSGCAIDMETGACPTCIVKIEPIVEPFANIKKDLLEAGESEIVRTSNSNCRSYFERDHGGRNICEIQRNKCDSKKFPTLCDINFKGCKEIEINYNIRFERNNGKLTCG